MMRTFQVPTSTSRRWRACSSVVAWSCPALTMGRSNCGTCGPELGCGTWWRCRAEDQVRGSRHLRSLGKNVFFWLLLSQFICKEVCGACFSVCLFLLEGCCDCHSLNCSESLKMHKLQTQGFLSLWRQSVTFSILHSWKRAWQHNV